jgi:Protein of unknown function (DUF3575).
MKKVVLITAFVAAFVGAHAQDGNQNVVKLNPLSLFLATGNVSYERAVSSNQTFQIGLFYTGVGISDLKYSGLGITPEYRFYVAGRKEAMNGVYVAPFLRYQNFNIKEKSSGDKVSYSSFGGGALLGWEKTWGSGFVLDLFLGPSYNSGKIKENVNEDEWDISSGIDGFGLRTGIAIGFSF